MKLRSIFLAATVFGVGATSGMAQTTTWIGSSGATWSVVGNWSSGVPVAADTVVFSNTTGTSSVNAAFTMTNLEFTGGAAILTNGGGSISTSNGVFYGGGASGEIDVAVTGTGNLWMNGGSGTFTLSAPTPGANTFSGSTQIAFGATLTDGAAGSYSPNSMVYVGGPVGATLLVNFNESIAGLQDGSMANGLVKIANGMTLTLNGTYGTIYSGVISDLSGHGSVTIDSGSTATFEGTNTYTGTTTLNGSTLFLGNATAGGTIVSNVVGTGASMLTFNTTSSNVYAGILSGTLSVAQEGADTTTLTGTSTYTGGTFITSGSALQLGDGTTNGSINGTSSVSGSGTLAFFFVGSMTVPEPLVGSLNVVQSMGTTTLTANNLYSGSTTVGGGTLMAGSSTAFGGTGNSAVTVSSNGTLALGTFSNQIGSLRGTGTVSLGSGTLTVGNVSAPSTVFSGSITGTGGLTMAGYVLDLTSGNSYSGPTTVDAGTLEADNTTGFATGTGTILVNGGTLQIGNLDAHGIINTNNIVETGGQVAIARTDTMTFPNNISGAGGVEVAGGGTGNVTLSGNNTYTGPTNVINATLTAGTSTSLPASSDLTLSNGTLALNTNNVSLGSLDSDASSHVHLGGNTLTLTDSQSSNFGGSMDGTGGLVLNGAGEFCILGAVSYTGGTTIGTSGYLSLGVNSTGGASMVGNVLDNGQFQLAPFSTDNYLIAGAITGTGLVRIVGAGTVTLGTTNENTYTGITDVASATLTDSLPDAFSPYSQMFVSTGATVNVTQNEAIGDLEDGSGGGNVTIASGRALSIDGIYQPTPFTGTISGAGGININTGSFSQGFGGANTYTGGTTMTSGEIFVSSSTVGAPGSITSGPLGTNTLTFIGSGEMSSIINPVTLANAINLNSYNLDNDDATTSLTITGPISGVGGSITWCTNNLLALINTNTFTGGVDMRLGQLALGSDTGAGVGGTIILDSGTDLYTYGGPGITRTVANPINFTGGSAALGNNDDNYLVLTGAISGGGAVAFLGGSTGTLTLAPSSNTYNGNFEIASGTVYAANNNALSSAASVVLAGSTTLNVENGVTVGSPLIFSGAPNTLAGNGTISSVVTAGSSTIISPSASPGGGPGTLTFSSGLVLGTGAAIHFDLYNATGSAGTGFSLINASGGLNLSASNNTITFNVVSTNSSGGAANAINFNAATPFSWMFASSPTTITGFSPLQFNLVTSGFTNNTSGGTFGVSEVGNNLFLNFTPVPEPSTWALMGAGTVALAVVGLRRRRLARA